MLNWKSKQPGIRHRGPLLLHNTRRVVRTSTHGTCRIGNDTRRFVWLRDNGCCRNCGSNRDLQFDHIVPVAFGGTNVAEDVELLCRTCNLRKAASVAAPAAQED